MIVIYIGRRGSGKTLTMVKDAWAYHCGGRRILSNMEGLTFGKYITNDEILKIDKNSDIDNVVFLIDEMQIFFDSRRSMNKSALNFSNFVQQIRKRGCIILGTTQFSNSIDKRIRDHTDIVAKPKYKEEYRVCEVDYIDITALDTGDYYDEQPSIISLVYDATNVFKLYNTGEMIK